MYVVESGINGPDYSQGPIEQMAIDAEFALLTSRHPDRSQRFSADFIRRALPPAEAFDHAQVLNNLHDNLSGLKDAFAVIPGDSIARGAQNLLRGQLLALGSHVGNDRTDTAVHLRNYRGLELQLGRREPLRLLRGLDTALRKLHHAVTSDTCRPVLCAEGRGFKQFRFVDLATNLPPSVMLYIRPQGAYRYDEQREYGRPGKGVEASMSYTVQLDDQTPIALTKYDQRPDCISIRLDREAPEDPASPDGTISLDIGSVLGPTEAFGTKVGRLLAWGDACQSFDDWSYRDAYLNHVRLPDNVQRYGRADDFARAAAELDRLMCARAIPAAELRRTYGVRRFATNPLLASANT